MYIDDLRMRNKISNELWENISTIPEEDSHYDVFPGIECYYVELFINNSYHGLYNLNERLDEKVLNYSENQYLQGGVLYKGINWDNGSTRFRGLESEPSNSFIWEGWEQIYPKKDTSWSRLEKLRRAIVLSDKEDFIENIGSVLDQDNAVDYYLFINLIHGFDNTGKNTFVASYTYDSHFFIMPWDIECSWGLNWLKEKYNPVGYSSNGLFDRLIETNVGDYNQNLEDRWAELRQTHFSEENLIELINRNYLLMKNSGAYEREKNRWQEYPLDIDTEYAFITDWIKTRLIYLDQHFDYNQNN